MGSTKLLLEILQSSKIQGWGFGFDWLSLFHGRYKDLAGSGVQCLLSCTPGVFNLFWLVYPWWQVEKQGVPWTVDEQGQAVPWRLINEVEGGVLHAQQ